MEVRKRTANGGVEVRPLGSLGAVLYYYGQVPLPPYIQRPLNDVERYQTIYNQQEGSAAAPTAGLHFTPSLLDHLREKGVSLAFVTLHIGADTFQPIRTDRVEGHSMHAEYIEISDATATEVNLARAAGRRVIAIGTTAVRTLEAAALAAAGGPWLADTPGEAIRLAEPLPDSTKGTSTHDPHRGGEAGLSSGSGWTALYVTRRRQFRLVDAVITNFHLPRSTLLVLVSAFAGRRLLLDAYHEAIRLRYRFLSFGDAMMIL